jgi:hypothetical protein
MKDGTLLHGSIGFGDCPRMLTGEQSEEIRYSTGPTRSLEGSTPKRMVEVDREIY